MKVHLGIEVGEQYIKLLVAKRKGMQTKLLDCVIESIPAAAEQGLVTIISDLLHRNKYRPTYITMSLPRNFVTVRNLHLPSQDMQEIVKMIELHISRIVPYKKEEVVYSYQFAGIDDMGYARIMLAIVHSDIIRRQTEIIDKCGYLVDKITLSSYGIWQWVVKNFSSEINTSDLYLILDIDATFTDFLIFNRSNLLFTRSIAIKASEVEYDFGIKKLLGEIRQSLLIFSNEEINKKPAKVFLTGTFNETLSKLIEEELTMPVKSIAFSTFQDILKVKRKDDAVGTSPTALTELVLEESQTRLSFELPQIKIRKSLREKTKEFIILGSTAMYLLSIVCVIFLGRAYNRQMYLDKLKDRSESIEKDIGYLADELPRIEFVKKYLSARSAPSFIVYELQKIISENIVIEFLSFDDENKVNIRGEAMQLSDVFRFRADLEKVDLFRDVQTRYARQKKLKDKEIADFELTFVLDL